MNKLCVALSSILILGIVQRVIASPPTVSVIIPVCSRHDALRGAVRSVAKQTFTDWELLVVLDDGSNSLGCGIDVAGLLKLVADEGVEARVLSTKTDCMNCVYGKDAPGLARNVGLDHARGKYAAFMDDDDCMFPDRLERQVNALESRSVEMVSSDALVKPRGNDRRVPVNGRCDRDVLLQSGYRRMHDYGNSFYALPDRRYDNPIVCSSATVKISFLNRRGLRFDQSAGPWRDPPFYEDFEFWIALKEKGGQIFVDATPLVMYDMR